MKICDEYNVKDIKDIGYTPKGIIKFIDNDGNTIFEKHNLVVNKGRELMFALFLKYFNYETSESTITSIQSASSPIIKVTLSYDENNRQTVGSTVLTDIDQPGYTENITARNIEHVSVDEVSRSVTFSISINTDAAFIASNSVNDDNAESFRFNQIYLTYNIGNDQEFLFSRVAMDPVFLSQNMKYQLEYSLYF